MNNWTDLHEDVAGLFLTFICQVLPKTPSELGHLNGYECRNGSTNTSVCDMFYWPPYYEGLSQDYASIRRSADYNDFIHFAAQVFPGLKQ